MTDYILFGAGTIGRVVARELTAKGTPPIAFADNDSTKWGSMVEGVKVLSPADLQLFVPDATWIATALRTPFRTELQAQITKMGVKSISTWEYMIRPYSPPSKRVLDELMMVLAADDESRDFLWDQQEFRTSFDLSAQIPPADIASVYFESFFTHLDDEHFIDVGAAEGDTIRDFKSRWSQFSQISAFEPDPVNFKRLLDEYRGHGNILCYPFAIGDHRKELRFAASGDQTSHFSETGDMVVQCAALDELSFNRPPTFIKMDIEGAELEALWGAREIIRTHSPVLAICAYHTAEHLWQIPMLIHALNPDYHLFLRRYLEATWELVWYAVPAGRIAR